MTNITYNNASVYNYGPDFNILSHYSARPIQRLSVQRESNLDPSAQSKALMKVEGNKLVVAAPQALQKPNKQSAPKVVKEKLSQAPVEHGWEPLRDPKAQAELKEKIKKEDPKLIPPPTVQASEKAAPNPSVQSTANATVAPIAPREKNEKRKFETVAPPAPVAPKVAPHITPDIKPNRPAPDLKPEAGVDKSRHDRSADMVPKMTKEKPLKNAPVNPPPRPRDEGKSKKNEPSTSPTPS